METTESNIKSTTKKIKLDFKDSNYATGRRKKSIARVWFKKGTRASRSLLPAGVYNLYQYTLLL